MPATSAVPPAARAPRARGPAVPPHSRATRCDAMGGSAHAPAPAPAPAAPLIAARAHVPSVRRAGHAGMRARARGHGGNSAQRRGRGRRALRAGCRTNGRCDPFGSSVCPLLMIPKRNEPAKLRNLHAPRPRERRDGCGRHGREADCGPRRGVRLRTASASACPLGARGWICGVSCRRTVTL